MIRSALRPDDVRFCQAFFSFVHCSRFARLWRRTICPSGVRAINGGTLKSQLRIPP